MTTILAERMLHTPSLPSDRDHRPLRTTQQQEQQGGGGSNRQQEVQQQQVQQHRRHHHPRQRAYSRLTWGAYNAKDPIKYAGVSTPVDQRYELGIQGLVPATFIPLEMDVERCMEQLRSKSTDLEKYIYLSSIVSSKKKQCFVFLLLFLMTMMDR
jgi:hypothetical protein